MVTKQEELVLWALVAERLWLGEAGTVTLLGTFASERDDVLVPADYDEPGGAVHHRLMPLHVAVQYDSPTEIYTDE